MPVEKESRRVLARPPRRLPLGFDIQRDLHDYSQVVSFQCFLDALLDAKSHQAQTEELAESLSSLASNPAIRDAVVQYGAVIDGNGPTRIETDSECDDREERAFCALVNSIAAAAPRPHRLGPYSVNNVVFASTLCRPQPLSIGQAKDQKLQPPPPVIALRSANLLLGDEDGSTHPNTDLNWSDVLLSVEFDRELFGKHEESGLAYAEMLGDYTASDRLSGTKEKSAWVRSSSEGAMRDALPNEIDTTSATRFPGMPPAQRQADITEDEIDSILDAVVRGEEGGAAAGSSEGHWRAGTQPWDRPHNRHMTKEEGEQLTANARAKAHTAIPTMAQLFGCDVRTLLEPPRSERRIEVRARAQRGRTAESSAVHRLGMHATHVLAATHGTRVHALGMLVKAVYPDVGDCEPGRAARELELWYFDPSGAVRTADAVRVPAGGDDSDVLARFARVIWALTELDQEGWGVLSSSIFRFPLQESAHTADGAPPPLPPFPPRSLEGATRPLTIHISRDTKDSTLREEHAVTLVLRSPIAGGQHAPARGLVGRHGCAYRAEIAEMKGRLDPTGLAYEREVCARFEWRTVSREVERQKIEAKVEIDYMNAVLDRKVLCRLSKGLRGRLCPTPGTKGKGKQKQQPRALVGTGYEDRVLVMTVTTPFVDWIGGMRTRELYEPEEQWLVSDCFLASYQMLVVTDELHGDIAVNHMMVQTAFALTPSGVSCVRGFMNFLNHGTDYDEEMEEGKTVRRTALMEMMKTMPSLKTSMLNAFT